MKSDLKDYDRLSPDDPVNSALYIDKILDKFGIDINSPETQLNLRWKDVVGEDLAKFITFEKLKDGVLNLLCKNSAIATYVRINSKDILKKIDSAFPELKVKKLTVRVGL